MGILLTSPRHLAITAVPWLKQLKTVKPHEPQVLPAVSNPLGIRSVYTNNMDITGGPLDVRLDFMKYPRSRKLVRERRASVVMSVPHFRAMVKVLNDHVGKVTKYSAALEKALADGK